MVSRCRGVGEVTQAESLLAIEAVQNFLVKLERMRGHPKTSAELTLGATEERRGWDPTVATTICHTISLEVATDRDNTIGTMSAHEE